MSDRPIQVGDLVVVVGSCCSSHLGYVFKVETLFAGQTFKCSGGSGGCGRRQYDTVCAGIRNKIAVPMKWLKRIPPDILDADVEERREIKERVKA